MAAPDYQQIATLLPIHMALVLSWIHTHLHLPCTAVTADPSTSLRLTTKHLPHSQAQARLRAILGGLMFAAVPFKPTLQPVRTSS